MNSVIGACAAFLTQRLISFVNFPGLQGLFTQQDYSFGPYDFQINDQATPSLYFPTHSVRGDIVERIDTPILVRRKSPCRILTDVYFRSYNVQIRVVETLSPARMEFIMVYQHYYFSVCRARNR